MKNTKLDNLLDTTSYGQYDIQSEEAKKILRDNNVITLYREPTEEQVAWYEYVWEGFDGMDDSTVGSTAYAKYARPVIVSLYMQKDNFEQVRAQELQAIEDAIDAEHLEQQKKEQELKNGTATIDCSINEMKRGYSLEVTIEYNRYLIKQSDAKKIEKNLSLNKENICEHIENNYSSISIGRGCAFIRIGWEWYKMTER